MSPAENKKNCHSSQCGCNAGLNRRQFAGILGAGAAAALGGASTIMAGPFEKADFERPAPADKKLSPQWIRSLYARGKRTLYRGAELEKIGMPIGGICAGQLYLGGDGRLWRWDLFNRHLGTGDGNYAHPPKPDFPLQQGFAIRTAQAGKTSVRGLDRSGFSEITFCGEYPLGMVDYRDPQSPVAVSLTAYSPFVPLNADDSHLPATIMSFTVKNTSAEKVDCRLAGWLENAVCIDSGKAGQGVRSNRIHREDGCTLLHCTAEPAQAGGQPPRPPIVFADREDFGSMGLALLGPAEGHLASAALPAGLTLPQSLFTEDGLAADPAASRPLPERLVGALGKNLSLEPGQQRTVTFVVAWYFPNLKHLGLPAIEGRRYGKRFSSAQTVVRHVAENFATLDAQTRLWHDNWYDSTLPYWFLDRTFLNTSILATSTAYWFGNGRFYGWEGVGCCPGTCQHVWHYAQAMGRLFPSLERSVREMVDFGLAFDAASGASGFRAEFDRNVAIDGLSGTILRVYREHQMSANQAFLERLWPKVKKSLEYLIRQDRNQDGIMDGAQMNTLDAPWFGKIAWLSSLYVAALRAGEQMALEMGDAAFARQARAIADAGGRNIDAQLFNGEYYLQIPDEAHRKSVGSMDGCEIDQVFGQSWAFQVGLDRVLPREHTRTALGSLWQYNFTPDVGPFRQAHKPGRWYAMAGEGGLLMCSWPKGETHRVHEAYDYYFNECMTGFEYQVAGHMIWEGLVEEGLAVTRAIHDRYHASRRNPWNEVECGQLRRLSGGLRLRVPRAEGPFGVRAALDARGFPRRLHRRGRLGHLPPEARRAGAAGNDRAQLGQAAIAVPVVRGGRGRQARRRDGHARRQTAGLPP
ncbi:MAG: GH116 family glycosyl-hydrolase [Thermoguttaceae bacterium]